MAKYQITVAGQSFEIDAPDDAAAQAAVQQLVAAQSPAPAPAAEAPIAEGDWSGLGQRVASREQAMTDMGPTPPDWIESARQEEAKRQGAMYGAGRGTNFETAFRTYADEMAMGLPNYMEALTSGWGSGMSTAEKHEFIKAADAARGQANPAAATVGQIGAIGTQAISTPAFAAKGPVARILTGGAIGAGISGAGEGIRSRGDAEQIANATAMGGVFGLGGSGVVEAAAPLVRKGGNYLAERAAKFYGSPEDQAMARIVLAAQQKGITPEAARAEMARLGDEGMIADVMGVTGQRMARTAANTSPEADQIIAEQMARRAAGSPERLANAAYEAGGVAPGSTASRISEDIYQAAQPEISALYAAARAQGADLPAEPFRNLMQAPMMRDAVDRAIKETQNRVVAFGEGQNSKLGVFDAAKQNLDAIAEDAMRSGDKAKASLARKLASDLRQTVDKYSESYQPARDAARRVFQEQEAVQAGANAARSPNVATPSELAAYAGMEPRVAAGYASEIANSLLSKRGTPGLVDAYLGSPNQQSAMQAALGPRASVLADRADVERTFARTQKGATGNSTTAKQIADLGLIPGAAGLGWLGGYDPLQAGGLASLAVAGRRGVNKFLDARRSETEGKVALEIAKRLVQQSMPDMPKRVTSAYEKQIAASLIASGRALAAPAGAAIAVQE